MKHRMHFSRGAREEPEINLIPFIDVLLVVLIFLMLTTTYSKFTEMQLRLPTADVDAQRDYPKEVIVAIPTLIFWRYFRTRVDEYLLNLELAGERFARHLNALRR